MSNPFTGARTYSAKRREEGDARTIGRNGSTGVTDIGGVAMPLADAKDLTCPLPEFMAKMAKKYSDWAEFVEWMENRGL